MRVQVCWESTVGAWNVKLNSDVLKASLNITFRDSWCLYIKADVC
jgi:hypothetical protein